MAEWKDVGDQLDRTARQVRFLGRSVVHTVAAEWNDPEMGRSVRTLCCRVLAADTAIRTAGETTCRGCSTPCTTAETQDGDR